ncbi:MAG: DNA polymerase I, partial [Planctomycetota bacterium]|nr:DNA polymerase I [Planctomycetota bacterium]
MPRLFLLDGTALAYRSHFALARSGLTSTDGRPTGATYGFTMTLRRILEQEAPDAVAVAFDPRGGTFRHKMYAEYKATREKAPEEMIAQLDDIRDVVRAHGLPIFEVPGYEADDVIGTLAKQGEAAGYEVLIVTADKDLMQLVSDRVKLYDVFKKGEDVVLIGAAEVAQKFGTGPEGVVDVLAIMGDASDNVPGVKGIGEKGAIKLIEEFGTVEGVLEHLDEVKGKAREYIERDREQLLLSKELVTLDLAVPLEQSIADLGPPAPDVEKLLLLFRALDFQTLVKKVAETSTKPPAAAVARDYITIEDRAGLEAMIAELREAGSFAWDTETTGLRPLEAKLVGMSFSARAGRAFYVPFNAFPDVIEGGPQQLLAALAPLLTDPDLQRAGQNYKYDALVTGEAGLEVPAPDFDTLVASYTIYGALRRHSLDDLALHYFDLAKIGTTELIGTGRKQITMAEVSIERVAEYACEDADVTWRLKEVLERELEETGNQELFHGLEMQLVPVLTAMERRGIRLDVSVLEELGKTLGKELEAAEDEVRRLAGEPGMNVNSTKTLGAVLFEKLRIQEAAGVKKPKQTKTGWATDHATLTQHYADVEIVQRLLEYREVSKLRSTYVEALPHFVHPRTGRVHCHLSQTTAATGRLASSDPNLQNIPVRTERGRKLREAFVPRVADEHGEWVLLAADYSQVELRIMAHLSGDPGLTAAFERGDDIHASTASVIFDVPQDAVDRGMRSQAKAINFGLLYGMGSQRLARDTGLTVTEAKAFIERYFSAFPSVRAWIDGVLDAARANGYVETLMGRRRPIPDINSSNNRARVFAENTAVNTPVQGSAADIIKRAMIDLEARLSNSELKGQMLLQVHDELLLEVPLSELAATTEMVR